MCIYFYKCSGEHLQFLGAFLQVRGCAARQPHRAYLRRLPGETITARDNSLHCPSISINSSILALQALVILVCSWSTAGAGGGRIRSYNSCPSLLA
jgi:hypothetical protein